MRFPPADLPTVSLADFDMRRDAVMATIIAAAEDHGAFLLVDHGLNAVDIQRQYDAVRRFFALPGGLKDKAPFALAWNAHREAVEMRADVIAGNKAKMLELSDTLAMDFAEQTLAFTNACDAIARRLVGCFVQALGLDPDVFVHQSIQPALQATRCFVSGDGDQQGPATASEAMCCHRGGDHGSHGDAHACETDLSVMSLVFAELKTETDRGEKAEKERERLEREKAERNPRSRKSSRCYGYVKSPPLLAKSPTPSPSSSTTTLSSVLSTATTAAVSSPPLVCRIGELLAYQSAGRFKAAPVEDHDDCKAAREAAANGDGDRYRLYFSCLPKAVDPSEVAPHYHASDADFRAATSFTCGSPASTTSESALNAAAFSAATCTMATSML